MAFLPNWKELMIPTVLQTG